MTTTLTTIMTLTITIKSTIVLTIILTMTMMRIAVPCHALQYRTYHCVLLFSLLISLFFSSSACYLSLNQSANFFFLCCFILSYLLLANLSCVYVHYTTSVFSLIISIHIQSFHSLKLYYFSLKIDENCQILSSKPPVNKIYFT